MTYTSMWQIAVAYTQANLWVLIAAGGLGAFMVIALSSQIHRFIVLCEVFLVTSAISLVVLVWISAFAPVSDLTPGYVEKQEQKIATRPLYACALHDELTERDPVRFRWQFEQAVRAADKKMTRVRLTKLKRWVANTDQAEPAGNECGMVDINALMAPPDANK